MRCSPTASCSPASRPRCCRWPSAISCSDRTGLGAGARRARGFVAMITGIAPTAEHDQVLAGSHVHRL
jgi:hypothetical protein